MNKRVEAEGSELVIRNENGDYAIIPKAKRKEVMKAIEDNCHDCVDSIVRSLPLMSDYAEDGTLIPDPPDKQNIQELEHIKFDSNKAKKGSYGNLIVKDIDSNKDYGVVRKTDGSYEFWNESNREEAFTREVERQRRNYLEYVNSDLYKERLAKEGHRSPDEEYTTRYDRIKNANVNFTDLPEKTLGRAIDTPPFNPNIQIDVEKIIKSEDPYIVTHELSHAADARINFLYDGAMKLWNEKFKEGKVSQEEYEKAYKRIYETSNKTHIPFETVQNINESLSGNGPDFDEKDYLYLTNPTEVIARIQAFRAYAKDKKLYDHTKEEFTEETLKLIEKSKDKTGAAKDLYNIFIINNSPDRLKNFIKLMNTVADNTKTNTESNEATG